MPDISILQPTVLRGIIEKFAAPESLTLLNRVPQTPHPFPTVQWEIIRGSRNIATPNVPNSEAHIVPRLGRTTASAAFVYLREKKVFEPTTLHWLRQAASNLSDLARTNAEQAVLREVADLNQRFDNFAEWMLWQALTGTLDFDYNDVQSTVDYHFLDSHTPLIGHDWSSADPQELVSDIRTLKRIIERDGNVPATEAFVADTTIDYIFDSYSQAGASLPGALLTDNMKNQYFTTGTLPSFMGLQWHTETSVFDATGSSYTTSPTRPAQETRFLAEDALIFGNFTANRPIELYIGPTADDEAPDGYTGKFSKTWKEKDPSARQFLLEWNLLPVITRAEQFIYVADVTDTTP